MALFSGKRSAYRVAFLILIVSVLFILLWAVRMPTQTVNNAMSPGISPAAGILSDALADESMLNTVLAEFPDTHFLFTDIISRTVTKTPSGYRMNAVAKGLLEVVTYIHAEDLDEGAWEYETRPETANRLNQEFAAVKDGVRMHYIGEQINPVEVSFVLELSR